MGLPSLWPLISFLVRLAATLFVLLLGRLAYLLYLQKKPLDPRIRHYPSPPGEIPIFGHLHLMTEFGALEKAARQCGPVLVWKNFHETWIVVSTPELCQAVLNHPNSIRDNWINDMEGDIFGRAMFVSEGIAWSHPRSVLSTVVTREALGNLCPIIVRKADSLLSNWFAKGTKKEAKILFDYDMVALTMDVICEIIIGCDLHVAEGDPKGFRWHYHNMGAEWMSRIMFFNFLPICHKLPFISNLKCWYSHRAADAVVKEAYQTRRALIEKEPGLRTCMMDALIHADFTLAECQRELTGMIFAGHDTTAHTIAFATYELSRNPEVLARLRKEAQEVIGGLPADKVGLSHVNQLTFAAQVLRIYPIAGAVVRTFTEDTTISGYTFPRGVACHIMGVQYDPSVFPEPKKWLPDRWADGKVPPASWIPFAAGPHVCLGQNVALLEAKLTLAYMSLKANFEVDPKYELTPYSSPTLAPAKRLPMRATLLA